MHGTDEILMGEKKSCFVLFISGKVSGFIVLENSRWVKCCSIPQLEITLGTVRLQEVAHV